MINHQIAQLSLYNLIQKHKMRLNIKEIILFVGATILILGGVIIGHFATEQDTLKQVFDQWRQQHKMAFESKSQIFYRFGIFKQNYFKIQAHNQKQGTQYQMGLTHNANEVDWRQKGAVTPVKNMGQCAASSAFSVTPPIEALSWIKSGNLTSYSQQFLLDCCGTSSCQGGFSNVEAYYKCVAQKGIIVSQKYPYTGNIGPCKTNQTDFKISGYVKVSGCDQIIKKVYDSPVTVFADASKWMYYRSGIMKCDEIANVNHIVSIVAVHPQAWTLKNQWGTSWGEQGFIRLAPGNSCGICTQGIAPYINKVVNQQL